MIDHNLKQPSSFRDPAGFLFYKGNRLLRQINPCYYEDYDYFIQSGLYTALCEKKYIIPHVEKEARVIQPEWIPFISYPYEWSFSQIKEAALLTLNIQKMALAYGMVLKDASAYNVQFYNGQAIFIDTLSFEKYDNMPWRAYRQFCQHFLAPLMLMAYRDVRLNQLLRIYLDGIPLDLASHLLPFSTRFKFSSILHIHAHARLQKQYQTKSVQKNKIVFQSKIMERLIVGLLHTVENLHWKIEKKSQWYDYYLTNNNYTLQALTQKEETIKNWIATLKPSMLWDLGANTGRFSMIVAPFCKNVVAFDADASCVESFYLHLKKHSVSILPLLIDLTNPSPALGWSHQERNALLQRGPADVILALGLLHHLAIVNNVPLLKVAAFFAECCEHLIIEFVPKQDSQVQKLLHLRKDVFPDYNLEKFQEHFLHYFDIVEQKAVPESSRVLFLMKKLGKRND